MTANYYQEEFCKPEVVVTPGNVLIDPVYGMWGSSFLIPATPATVSGADCLTTDKMLYSYVETDGGNTISEFNFRTS